MQVLELWRYPVKSMGGERVEACAVTELGLAHDRHWALVRASDGVALTARRHPELLLAGATVDDRGEACIALPDGTEVTSNDPAIDVVLSRWLGTDVHLAVPDDQPATYEIDLADEGRLDHRWGEAVTTWSGSPGRFHDSTRVAVSIVGVDSLRGWDPRRFRANVVVSGGDEASLVSRTIALGSAEVKVLKAIDRCVLVTRPQPGIERDLDVLRTVNRDLDGHLAVGGLVRRPGEVAVGDRLQPVERDHVSSAS